MAKKKPNTHAYKIWMHPDVHINRKKLPGKIRQRIKRIIARLAQEPYPSNSISLNLIDATDLKDWKVKRIRIDELISYL